ncbi:MAG: hypothetical protein ACXV5U_00575 [Ilumatobacteraceae bacterium]
MTVAYQRSALGRIAARASVVHRQIARWSGWPVKPSGPKVTMRSGRISAMWQAIVFVPSC